MIELLEMVEKHNNLITINYGDDRDLGSGEGRQRGGEQRRIRW